MNKKYLETTDSLLILLLFASILCFPQCSTKEPQTLKYQKFTYFQNDIIDLNLYIFPSESQNDSPVIMMIHGGYWANGSPMEFAEHAHYFSSIGFTSICIEYRIKSKFNTHPQDMIDDAIKAYRWIISNSDKLEIDTNKIIIMGGSAGGHIAYWVDKLVSNESVKPAALILLDAVLDVTILEKADDIFGEDKESLSPIHNISQSLTPTLLIASEYDELVSQDSIKTFQKKMNEHGNNLTVKIIPSAFHGSYIWKKGSIKPKAVSYSENWLSIIIDP